MRSSIIFLLSLGFGCASGAADGDRPDFGPGADLGGTDAQLPAEDGAAPEDGFVPGADGSMAMEDAGGADLGDATDAGSPDAFRPDLGPVPCTGDAECDDGDNCNGAETCVGGTCMGGTPRDCSDGVSCTVDGCSSSTCTHTPDDTLCAGSLTCDATEGCVDATCAESPCRLVAPQCGCPSGQACTLAAGGSRSCRTEGSNDESERCDSGGCLAGLACVDVSLTGTEVPLCKRFCDSDADCTGGPGSVCLAELGTTGQDICTSSCEPASQVGCPANSYCGLFTETATGRRLTDCSGPVGTGGQGTPCAGSEECQKGFTCATIDSLQQCARWCRRSPLGGECAFGETCIGFMDPLVFNSVEYGVCF